MTADVRFVLIRGLMREARHWGVFTTMLQQQFPDAQIITPDLPGNGRLNHQTSPDTIAGMTEALRAQVTACQNLRLIAISMGGMIAIDWMSRYPAEVKSAVLINTSARHLSPFYHRLRLAAGLHIVKMFFHSPIQREADILALTSNKWADNRSQLAIWQAWQRQNPVSFKNAINQCLAAIKFSIRSYPYQPMLVIAGKADRLVNYCCSVRLAQVLRAEYIQHETAGHDLPLDEPEWLVDVIQAWTTSNSS
ncbi:MAG: alpha/beta hydrolase [Nitrosomonas sp.]|nr:alpha/beta hydrolase [Nitrosomonas sp.]